MNVRLRNIMATGLSLLMVALALVSVFFSKRSGEFVEKGVVVPATTTVELGPANKGAMEWYESQQVVPEPIERKSVPVSEPIGFAVGDEYQGMWNHRKANHNLRMKIVSVDEAERRVTVSLRCEDFGGPEKEMSGTVSDSGGKLFLKGVAGTGIDDPGERRSIDVRDLLYVNSAQAMELAADGRTLKGEVGTGANVYFWALIPGED